MTGKLAILLFSKTALFRWWPSSGPRTPADHTSSCNRTIRRIDHHALAHRTPALSPSSTPCRLFNSLYRTTMASDLAVSADELPSTDELMACWRRCTDLRQAVKERQAGGTARARRLDDATRRRASSRVIAHACETPACVTRTRVIPNPRVPLVISPIAPPTRARAVEARWRRRHGAHASPR